MLVRANNNAHVLSTHVSLYLCRIPFHKFNHLDFINRLVTLIFKAPERTSNDNRYRSIRIRRNLPILKQNCSNARCAIDRSHSWLHVKVDAHCIWAITYSEKQCLSKQRLNCLDRYEDDTDQ